MMGANGAGGERVRFGAHYLTTYLPELDGSVSMFYRTMFDQIIELEALGYDDAWVTEHHFHEYGGVIPDPAVFLAAAAAQTTRIHLGIAIVVLPLHNPIQAAERYAMVDCVSNGRLEFGIGRGTPSELQDFGAPVAESAARLRDYTAVIRQSWSDAPLDFAGQTIQAQGMRVLPKPVQRPHPPIWVAANRSDDSYRWAGSQGYHLMTLPYSHDPVELGEQIAAYRTARAAAGFDPATGEVLGKFHIYVAESDAAAETEAAPYLMNYYEVADRDRAVRQRPARVEFREQLEKGTIIAGDAARCVDHIQSWQERLGLTTISGTFHFGGMPQELALANIRRFAERVMPAFPLSRLASTRSR